jgi:hypothetical protein
MSRSLKMAALARWAPAAAYLLSVIVVGCLIYGRTLPPDPVATSDFDRNHQLTPGDLQTDSIARLRGRYLREEVKQGESITASMASEKQLPARFDNMVAAVIGVPTKTVQARAIRVGADVKICVKDSSFGDATKVLSIEDCDEQRCWVLVKLSKAAIQRIDSDALSDARIIAAPETCAAPSP